MVFIFIEYVIHYHILIEIISGIQKLHHGSQVRIIFSKIICAAIYMLQKRSAHYAIPLFMSLVEPLLRNERLSPH